ncbi:universal stress protein [Streptomyces sp. TRM66268-LWL]|uniref:Universal stress protein n=1 Tax=Streptomyces polyasparticus TaxID=2767826 RepID=A0ABR7SGP2_9ACTN|nr:universal stress protein [Streptomyces polyasparticus]MBC9713905.1 universal stress protein [Streptomyces polyasparticus]
MTGPVVVGLDGSPASLTAAWWAAREALKRNLSLLLLHSWTTQPLDVPIAQAAPSKQQYGREVLHRAEAEILHRYGDLTLTTQLVSDPASRVLVERSRSAAMLVLGSRGHGTLTGFLLGSTSLHVLGRTHCPAVAVRSEDPSVECGWGHPAAADRNEVVVGMGELGPAAGALLEFAFADAELNGSRIRAVRACPLLGLVTDPHLMATEHPGDRYKAEEQTRLADALAPWREKFPTVPVVEHIAVGPAAHVLLATAPHARLAVVGRRRRPSHHTWHLGPVAHGALHHLPCPVAVIPHD